MPVMLSLNIKTLKRYCTSGTTFYFMKFYFVKWKNFQNYDSWKNPQVKLKYGSNVMPVFVFYLWRYLWETTGNILYNSLLSRNTRSLYRAKFFNRSLSKLIQIESSCDKALILQNFCKIICERYKTGAPYEVIFQSPSKQFESIYRDQTTIETTTISSICIFKSSNPIL